MTLKEFWDRVFRTGPLNPRRRMLWFCVKHRWGRTFMFEGTRYRYAYRSYNATYSNERAVELPVVWTVLRAAAGKRVLEVGNVLSHYYRCRHDVVDKYEQAPGVIDCDVVDYAPAEPYDLIISISTLEHVGWDEEPHDPDKIFVALEHLTSLLAPGGRLLFTMALGQHTTFDAHLRDGRLKLDEQHFLKRIAARNTWAEVTDREVGWTYPENLLIGTILGPPCDAPTRTGATTGAAAP